MDAMCYACLYNDYGESLEAFSDEEFGRLTRAMIRYNTTGEVPVFTGNERFIWPMLQSQMDRDRKAYTEKCENNRRNGKKGGRPKKEEITDGYSEAAEKTDRFFEKPKKPKEKENENEKENEKEKDNEKVNEKEREKNKNTDTEKIGYGGCTASRADPPDAAQPPQPPRRPPEAPSDYFIPPTVEEVREYCCAKGYAIDPEPFVDYYTSIGWMQGNRYVRKWKAALARWNAKEKEYAKRTKYYEPEIPTWTVGVQL